MMNPSVQVWQIQGKDQALALALQAGALDEVSRRLPQGLYSTFRTFGERTRALDLRHHLERLYRPAAQMKIEVAVEARALRRLLAKLLACHPAEGEARVRISLSTEAGTAGALFVAIEPLPALPQQVYRQGVRVVTSRAERANPRLKSTAFIRSSQQERSALAASGAFEALMVRNGRILEGLTSNFYYIQDGVLGTAQRGILPGVTRRLVLNLARELGLPVRYRALAVAQLGELAEAFITSSSRGIVPVVSIDAVKVGQGLPGPLTRRLMARYNAEVERRARSIAG
jgi:branched-chain amino acid aminotransferase